MRTMNPNVVATPGTKRQRYIEENVAAESIALSADDVRALDATFPPGVASGTRYSADSMKLLEI